MGEFKGHTSGKLTKCDYIPAPEKNTSVILFLLLNFLGISLYKKWIEKPFGQGYHYFEFRRDK